MVSVNARGSERTALLARVPAASVDNQARQSGWFKPANFGRLTAAASFTGLLDVTASVTLYKAADDQGTGSEAVTQQTLAVETNTSSTSKDVLLDFDVAATDADKPYLMLELAAGDSAQPSLLGHGVVLGLDPAYAPASGSNLPGVTVAG
jgi:hypothetical protein